MKSRVWAISSNGLFKYIPLTQHHLTDALNIMRNCFFKEEYISTVIGLSKVPEAICELDELVLGVAKDGVSVIAIEEKSQKPAAVLLNKVLIKEEAPKGYFKTFNMNNPLVKQFNDINAAIDGSLNCYEFLKTNCYFETMFAAVLPEYRQNNLALEILNVSLRIAQSLKNGQNVQVSLDGNDLSLHAKPNGVVGVCTSPISTKLLQRLEFSTAKIVRFDDSLGTVPLAPIPVMYKLLK